MKKFTFLDQRKQAKIQWLQDSNQSNLDNLNNVRRDASRHFRNKKKAYLRAKIEELETNSKINNIRYFSRGINDIKKGYRNNIIRNEKGDMVTDSTVLWLGGGTISVSCSVYMGLMMLGRQKYTQ